MQSKILSNSELMKCWENALERMHETIKDSHESNGIHMCRCWFEGILNALTAQGYEVTISKQGKEYHFGTAKRTPELG